MEQTQEDDWSRERVVLEIMSQTLAAVKLGNDKDREFTVIFENATGYDYNIVLSIAGKAGFVPVSMHDETKRKLMVEFAPSGIEATKTYLTHEANYTDKTLQDIMAESEFWTEGEGWADRE